MRTRTVHFFIGWIHWQISRFPRYNLLYIHNYGIFSQLVYKAIKSFKLGATGPERFNLGKAQGRRMSARGRFVVPQEETEVVRCGWNNDSSSKFKKSSKTQPEVLLALTTFNLLLHMLVCVCVSQILLSLQKWWIGDSSSSCWSFISSFLWQGWVTSSLLRPRDLAAVLWASRSRPPASEDSPVRERKCF